jgi:hypothetical protein
VVPLVSKALGEGAAIPPEGRLGWRRWSGSWAVVGAANSAMAAAVVVALMRATVTSHGSRGARLGPSSLATWFGGSWRRSHRGAGTRWIGEVLLGGIDMWQPWQAAAAAGLARIRSGLAV